MVIVLRLHDGKLTATDIDGEFDITEEGIYELARAIIEKCGRDDLEELKLMCSSSLDFPHEYGGKKGADYGKMVATAIAEHEEEYHASLLLGNLR